MQKTVLIIEDEKNLAELIRHQLTARQYQVLIAQNGREGLEKLQAIKPDLIILDINMPEMNGLDFYRAITAEHGRPRFPVLVLTSRTEMEKTFTEVFAAGFMPKPFLIEELIQKVEDILTGYAKPVIFLLDSAGNEHTPKIQAAFSAEQYEVVMISDLSQIQTAAARRSPIAVVFEYGLVAPASEAIIHAVRSLPGGEGTIVLSYSFAGHAQHKTQSLADGADSFLDAPQQYEDFITALREIELKRG